MKEQGIFAIEGHRKAQILLAPILFGQIGNIYLFPVVTIAYFLVYILHFYLSICFLKYAATEIHPLFLSEASSGKPEVTRIRCFRRAARFPVSSEGT